MLRPSPLLEVMQEEAAGLVGGLHVLLPSQVPRRSRVAGEVALAAALLLDACHVAGVVPVPRRRPAAGPARALARRWLCGELDGRVDYPVELACTAVGLDPAVLARFVQRLSSRCDSAPAVSSATRGDAS